MSAKSGLFSKPAVRLADIMAPERNSFGLIRLAMAITVLFSHSYLFLAGTSRAEPLAGWTGHSLGEHGVQVFFFLSGILIAQSFEASRSLLEFAVARVLRILPALAVCVLATAFVLGPLVSTLPVRDYLGDPLLARYIVKTVLLVTGAAPLPGVFGDLPLAGDVNLSVWTLKYEVLCYAGLRRSGWPGCLTGASGLAPSRCCRLPSPACSSAPTSPPRPTRRSITCATLGSISALARSPT